LVPQQAENANNYLVDGSESGMVDNTKHHILPEMALYTCMTAPVDTKLLDEVLLMNITMAYYPGTDINLTQVDAVMRPSGGLEKIYFNIPKTLRHAAVEMSRDDFRRLRPKAWFNDEIVNAYVSLLDAHTPDDIMFLSSFFIAQLNSGGYRKVARFLKGASLFYGTVSLTCVANISVGLGPAEARLTKWKSNLTTFSHFRTSCTSTI